MTITSTDDIFNVYFVQFYKELILFYSMIKSNIDPVNTLVCLTTVKYHVGTEDEPNYGQPDYSKYVVLSFNILTGAHRHERTNSKIKLIDT